MNIFVTGSTGFLGSYFRKHTLGTEHTFIYGTTSKINHTNYLQFDDLYANINDGLQGYKIDAIVHFASVIPQTFESAIFELFEKNIHMMNNLYQYAITHKIKKFIYCSSFGSMDHPEDLDIKDFYTMSKIGAEHFCKMMESKNIDAVSLRISAPYGEYSTVKNVINIFIDNALNNKDIFVYGSGKREQNFTYAGDIIHAIILLLNSHVSGTYSIVSKENTSMLQLAKTIIRLTSSGSKIILNQHKDPQEGYRPMYDYKNACKDFGYIPQYSIEDGLKRYLDWYISQ